MMLASDQKNTVLKELSGDAANAIAYTAHGHPSSEQSVKTQLGYNGEFAESQTGWQLLGKGYRPYNPRLMLFLCPDSFSPFGEGGINQYAYCGGEPIMRTDPTGHIFRYLQLPANPYKPLKIISSKVDINLLNATEIAALPRTSRPAPLGIMSNLKGRRPEKNLSRSEKNTLVDPSLETRDRARIANKQWSNLPSREKKTEQIRFNQRVERQTYDQDIGLGWTTKSEDAAALADVARSQLVPPASLAPSTGRLPSNQKTVMHKQGNIRKGPSVLEKANERRNR